MYSLSPVHGGYLFKAWKLIAAYQTSHPEVHVLRVRFLTVPRTRVTQQVWFVLVEAIAQSRAGAVLRYCVSAEVSL